MRGSGGEAVVDLDAERFSVSRRVGFADAFS
jgi:hypothetical protein